MKSFSKDIDLLIYEPSIFLDARFDHYKLTSGTGASLTDGILTCSGEDFQNLNIEPGYVVNLSTDADPKGFPAEIIEVISKTQLRVSMIRESAMSSQIMPKNASSLNFRIVSFSALAFEVMISLTRYFGIKPGNSNSSYDAENIVDLEPIRQVSAYGVLALIYQRVTAAIKANYVTETQDSQLIEGKAIHYEILFEKAKENCSFAVEFGDYGKTFKGGSFKLSRG